MSAPPDADIKKLTRVFVFLKLLNEFYKFNNTGERL